MGSNVTASATAAVDVIHPEIQISKTPATQAVAAGGTATFTIAVTNSGDANLTGVTVSDPQTPDCNRSIGALAAGASYASYTCTRTNVTAGFTNTANVTGKPPVGPDVTGSATAAVQLLQPGIQISKTPATQKVVRGGTATFTIAVTNNGNANLTGVAVSDPQTPDCNRSIGPLAKGASYPSYTCTRANVTASFTNTATVTGKPPSGPDVTASASASVVVTAPFVANLGACVAWKYPDGKLRQSCSGPVFWNARQLWLPLVLRN